MINLDGKSYPNANQPREVDFEGLDGLHRRIMEMVSAEEDPGPGDTTPLTSTGPATVSFGHTSTKSDVRPRYWRCLWRRMLW